MSAPSLEARAWLRTVGRPGPERWVWTVSALAWLGLTAPLWSPLVSGRHDGARSGSGMQMPMGRVSPGADAASWWADVSHHMAMWTAMVLAIMLPLVAWNLRQVGIRSPRGRRTWATVEVAAGWAAVWLVAGAVVSVAAVFAHRAAPAAVVVAVSVVIAVGWQFLRVRQVAVARCHRRFAPPLGRTARRRCLRFGGSLGRDCVLSCWAGMAVMTVADHALFVVLPLAWLSWRDRRRPPDRPGTAVSVAVVVLAGLAAVAVAGPW